MAGDGGRGWRGAAVWWRRALADVEACRDRLRGIRGGGGRRGPGGAEE